jgi:hypothetical protein
MGAALGAIAGLIGAGLQAQAQQDQLMFEYSKFNWEKQRANTQDRFAQASKTDQFGNTTGYDPISNKWAVELAPNQKTLMQAGEKEDLLRLTKDAPAARKIKEAVQQRAHDAKEPFNRASMGYQYDQPQSEASIRSDIAQNMAVNDMLKSKAEQAILMRQSERMGHGAKAAEIIHATDTDLGNDQRIKSRSLAARQEALKEYGLRQAQHEVQYGKPMEVWGNLMAQGGDIPNLPKSTFSDPSGSMASQMLAAYGAGTRGVSGALGGLASAAGKYPDLSSVAKALASIDSKRGKAAEEEDPKDQMGFSYATQGDRDDSGFRDSNNELF